MKKIAQTVIVADCYYTIANVNGKVIEAAKGGENGAAVQLATAVKAAANQEWAFLRMGEDVYRIQNRETGKMLTLMMDGTVDGTWLHQWEDANSSAQLWIVEAGNDGTVQIKAQLAPTKCIDVVGMSNEDGARIQIWQDVNGENQKWTINEVKERAAKKAETVEVEEKQAPAKKPAAKKTVAKKTAEEKVVSEKVTEQPVTEKVEPEQSVVEKAPAEKPVAAKPATTKPAAKTKKASKKKSKKK